MTLLFSINIIYYFCTLGFYFTILGCIDIELWSHPWWVFGLMSLTILFIFLLTMFIASYKKLRKEQRWNIYGIISQPPNNPFSENYFIPVQAPSRTSSLNEGGYSIDTWPTRIFIAIVLQCVALFLLSQLPGFQSPFWLGIVLQGYTYGSAALFYASGMDDPTGH